MTIDSNEPLLSVVIPAYNEAIRIPVAIRDASSALTAICGTAWELVVVDDGSTDKTVAVVAELSTIVPTLRVISHTRNLGKGAAVRTGVLAAIGQNILFADADGATPFREYERLQAALCTDVDIAIGSRQRNSDLHVQRRLVRAAAAGVFRGLVRWLVNPLVSDTQCGFKLFRRDVARRLFAQSHETGYLFDVEILGLARRHRIKVREVPVAWQDVSGSKIQLFRDSWRMFVGLLRVRRQIHVANVGDNLQSRTPLPSLTHSESPTTLTSRHGVVQ